MHKRKNNCTNALTYVNASCIFVLRKRKEVNLWTQSYWKQPARGKD